MLVRILQFKFLIKKNWMAHPFSNPPHLRIFFLVGESFRPLKSERIYLSPQIVSNLTFDVHLFYAIKKNYGHKNFLKVGFFPFKVLTKFLKVYKILITQTFDSHKFSALKKFFTKFYFSNFCCTLMFCNKKYFDRTNFFEVGGGELRPS